jgi:maltooligosyltrehalose synthase
VWKGSFVQLPFEEMPAGYRNVFTGEVIKSCWRGGKPRLHLQQALSAFPVALLVRRAQPSLDFEQAHVKE